MKCGLEKRQHTPTPHTLTMASPTDDDDDDVNNAAFEEAMDDVHTRFILNLPDEELRSVPRIFFQLEQAWWFYDDFVCDGAAAAVAVAEEGEDDEEGDDDEDKKNNKKKTKKKRGKRGGVERPDPLPRFKHVRPFALAMFKRSPLLRPMIPRFDEMYDEFHAYKRSISTYGTILLNAGATRVVLCRTWKGKFWTLPGGKVNQNESGMDAAARETYEETGFDPMCERGMCASLRFRKGGDDESPPWGPLRDSDKLRYTETDTNKRRTCYVCRGVPEDFPFEPVARKEVSEVAWHDLTSLPRQTFAVVPFVGQLKRWIRDDDERRRGSIGAPPGGRRPEAASGGLIKLDTRVHPDVTKIADEFGQ